MGKESQEIKKLKKKRQRKQERRKQIKWEEEGENKVKGPSPRGHHKSASWAITDRKLSPARALYSSYG